MPHRDEQIVSFTERYRLGTNQAYLRAITPDISLNAVSKVTARLCRQGLLSRYPLIPPEDYFTPGPVACRRLGLPLRRTEPLGPQALPMDYAVLLYCTHGQRTRLTRTELDSKTPWLPDELLHAPYTQTAAGLMELVRVDLGGSPMHVAKKAATDCARRMEIPEFCQLVEKDQFQLVVLTTTQSKARLIRQAMESLARNDKARFHLATIPRLSFLHLRQQ